MIGDVVSGLRERGFELDGEPFPTGRPDRATLALRSATDGKVVAKLFPAGGGERTFENMTELWRSSFGERRDPPGLPRPITYLSDLGALVMQRLEGRPLLEMDRAEARTLDGAIELLAALHESDAVPVKRRDPRRIVRSVQRKADSVIKLGSAHAPLFRELAAALAAAQPTDEGLVPSHGDFTPRNVLVGPERLSLIDLDRVQLAPPGRDVAYFGAWCWARDVRERRQPTWEALDHAVARYRQLRPNAPLDSLDFHVAAGLARIAHGLVELWRRDEDVVPQLAQAALARLR